jgi:hypothetical protein
MINLKVIIQFLIFGAVAGMLLLSASQSIWNKESEDDFEKYFDTVDQDENENQEEETTLPVTIGDNAAAEIPSFT